MSKRLPARCAPQDRSNERNPSRKVAKKEVELNRRRAFNILFTSLLIAALVAAYFLVAPAFPRNPYISGWFLFAVMLLLTFFNLRKKVPFLRMGSAKFWLQMHIYVGIFSGALFLVHIGWSWPVGIFDQLFSLTYVVVFLSGFVGLWISRSFPKRLTLAGYETPFEKMPFARAKLRENAEALILTGADGQTTPVLANFYTEQLGLFFTKPANLLAHLRGSRGPQVAHAAQFDEVQRYAKKAEFAMLDGLRDLVEQKHRLDYQYSLQLSLRLWLFVHIPLSYSVLIFSVLHIILVHSFSGAVT